MIRRLLLGTIFFLAIAVLGACGGALAGWLFFVVFDFLGKSGTTGTEYFGYWNPQGSWFDATVYAAPLGGILLPLGYGIFLRRLPFPHSLFRPSLGVLCGGLIGAAFGPWEALFWGIVGFFAGCKWAELQTPNDDLGGNR